MYLIFTSVPGNNKFSYVKRDLCGMYFTDTEESIKLFTFHKEFTFESLKLSLSLEFSVIGMESNGLL